MPGYDQAGDETATKMIRIRTEMREGKVMTENRAGAKWLGAVKIGF